MNNGFARIDEEGRNKFFNLKQMKGLKSLKSLDEG